MSQIGLMWTGLSCFLHSPLSTGFTPTVLTLPPWPHSTRSWKCDMIRHDSCRICHESCQLFYSRIEQPINGKQPAHLVQRHVHLHHIMYQSSVIRYRRSGLFYSILIGQDTELKMDHPETHAIASSSWNARHRIVPYCKLQGRV